MPSKRGILERLEAGEVVVGDGGFVFALEKRGYVKAGVFTPECVVEHPDAVLQLHKEFFRAGADVMQAYNFYASEDKLENRGNTAIKYGVKDVNEAACRLAHEVADPNGALVAGGLCLIPSYFSGKGEKVCKEIFQRQVDVLVKCGVDFIIGETFGHVEQAVWATEVSKASGLPVAMCFKIHKEDLDGVPIEEVAARVAKAGADIIGVNCSWDPSKSLEAMQCIKEGLNKAGLSRHLMVQPLGYHTPDVPAAGFTTLPEFPYALEPRTLTRFDVHKFARQAYDMGIRYIGGCCGFEPYHIRAIAEELAKERGKLPPASDKHGLWGEALSQHTMPWVRARAQRSYWENLQPASGRPYSAALSEPASGWGVTAGDKDMLQHKEMTSQDEIQQTIEKARVK